MPENNSMKYHSECLTDYMYARGRPYPIWYLIGGLLCILICFVTIILNGIYLFIYSNSIRLRQRIGDKLTMLLATVDILQGSCLISSSVM